MSNLRRLQSQIVALRESVPPCPGPPIQFREGTLAELAAWPDPPAECPACGLAHEYEGVRFVEVVRPDGMERP
jgi:hypothetical protein